MTAVGPDVPRTDAPDPAGPAPRPAAGSTTLTHACEPAPSGDVSGTPPSTAGAARSRPRLVGIDAARGIALLGMMAVHVLDPVDADGNISTAYELAAGKSAALFALLAGVGVAFASGRGRPSRGRDWAANSASLLVRALVIGAVGLLIGYLVPIDRAAVILPYYALLFVLAIPLLALSIRGLVVAAAVIGVGMPVLSHVLRAGTELATAPNRTFGDLVGEPGALLSELALTGTYPALTWIAYLCVGMAVGRSLLSSRRTVALFTLVGAGLVIGARIVSWLLLDVLGGREQLGSVAGLTRTPDEISDLLIWGPSGITPADTPWWLATLAPHSSTPLDMANTIGIGLVVLGICIFVGRTTTTFLRPIAAAGSMTLTLYCLHLLMLSSPFMPAEDSTSFLLQVLVVVAFALVWSASHARGPLEEFVALATRRARDAVRGSAASRSGAPARH